MKKLLFLGLILCAVWACTKPEEDSQIKRFWTEQMRQLFSQPADPVSPLPQPVPAAPEEDLSQQSEITQETEEPQPLETTQQPQTPQEPAPTPQESPASTEQEASLPQPSVPPAAVPPTAAPAVASAPRISKTAVASKPKKPQHTDYQFIEIVLEDSSHINNFKSNAPIEERRAMQRAIERVKRSNQQALEDIGTMFDGDTQAQAFAIVSNSEKILFRTANVSSNYQNYLNAQKKILQEQDRMLNQLMRANASKIRQIRG